MSVVPGAVIDKRLTELYVVYDADGTVVGELFYSVRKWLGRAGCSACDITHGPHKEKDEFRQFKDEFEAPVYNIHRDEMDLEMRRLVNGRLPCVLGRLNSDEYVYLLDNSMLERCSGKVHMLKDEIANCLTANQIALPNSSFDKSATQDQMVPGGTQICEYY
eukprot:Plantae.Rhodophyta-Purpureofilum_apyrenoidigerum.ctg32027.p1 GENE.Plantae.Rhodophyta-Purpureofilum_apyrenoidigerum.ctg32027~~Plantae.Rhodophyta-Purpureofilum_apyrenoidigerum.ctg32027.p1  ORF type:complete len:162 (-),score=24.18 Plantae.Rhodophyta-Purpureofilum_apyrenoidigerum.ctg32027:133-618(-)